MQQHGTSCVWQVGVESATMEFIDTSSVAFAHGTNWFACGRTDGVIEIREVKSGQLVASLAGPRSTIVALAFSPDDKTVLARTADQTLHFWQPDSSRETLVIHPLKPGVFQLPSPLVGDPVFRPDGQAVALTREDGTLSIWDAPQSWSLAEETRIATTKPR
jgi:WD40 repeat protein